MPADHRPVSVLTIAGSDAGGGAGLQADLKTFAAHGVHGLVAVTATTAQNTGAVTSVHVVPPAHLEAQVEALFDDFRIGAVKIGMLGTRAVVRRVARLLARHRAPNVVLDPVMVASSGAALLDRDAIRAVRDELMPLATLATPNLPEAALLLGRPLAGRTELDESAVALRAYGAEAVLLKGGHLARGPIIDVLALPAGPVRFSHPRLGAAGHGTGCTLASAAAAQLARGATLEAAAKRAIDYVHGALAHGYRPGRGAVRVLDHFWHMRARRNLVQFAFR